MTDDIATRLHNFSSAQDWETTKYLCADAADEIERLRNIIEEQSSTIRHLADKLTKSYDYQNGPTFMRQIAQS